MRPATGGEGAPFNAGRHVGAQTSVQSSDTVVNSTDEFTLVSSQLAFPAHTFNTIGAYMRVHARGTYETDANAPTLRTRLYMDATAIADTTACLQSPNVVNQGWSVDVDIVCVMTGANGSLEVQGVRRASTGTRSSQIEGMESTATFPFNTSLPFTLGLSQQFNASATDNSSTMRQFFCTMWSPV